MSSTILLISSHSDDSLFATGVASAVGLPMTVAQDAKGAVASFAKDCQSLVVLADVSTPELYAEVHSLVSPFIGDEAGKIRAKQVHFITTDETAEAMMLTSSPIFEHLIIRKVGDLGKAGEHYGRIVRAFLNHDKISLEHLVPNAVRELPLQHSSQKPELLDQIRLNLTEEAGYTNRIAETIVSALDELLMNAIYDAPARSKGQDAPDMMSRTEPVALEGKHSVGVKCAQDDDYSAFSVSDQFGSIDKVRLFKHILRTFRQKTYVVDDSKAGAGLGLAMTFRAGGSFLFFAEPGKKTEVTVFFKRTRSYTDFKEQFRFVSVHLASL